MRAEPAGDRGLALEFRGLIFERLDLFLHDFDLLTLIRREVSSRQLEITESCLRAKQEEFSCLRIPIHDRLQAPNTEVTPARARHLPYLEFVGNREIYLRGIGVSLHRQASLFDVDVPHVAAVKKTTGATKVRFDGADYRPKWDDPRLSSQIIRVYRLMRDGKFRTLEEIHAGTGDPVASISAQLRHLRKKKFGGHTVNRRIRGDRLSGLYEYQLIVNGRES